MSGVFESIAGAIGNTPLVRLNRVTEGLAATVYVKLEYLNPLGSVKDRAALSMILAAERSGELRPGGTVVEATSGNTGIALAAIAAARGYRSVVVVPDKSSAEKVALLRAYGAEVHVSPGSRPSHHPEFVRNVARRLAAEIPGGWLAGQYDNPANPEAHRATTGPEIWAQTGGAVTHYVAGVGTGGTVSGAGEFLKEASGGAVRVIGADPETSAYGGGDGRAWYVESVGHHLHPETEADQWPASYHTDVIDALERVGDAEALHVLQRLAREEGLLLGGSSGTAVAAALRVARGLGPEAVVVVIAPDSGRSYLSKYFDDEWLGRLGFPLFGASGEATVAAALTVPLDGEAPTIGSRATVGAARALLGAASALPVLLQRNDSGPVQIAEVLGSARAVVLAQAPDADPVLDHLSPPLPVVGTTDPISRAAERISDYDGPVVIAHEGRGVTLVDATEIAAARKEVQP
ncbi:PLP-dependent cysteine synthase family protein [Nocardia sp. alder85J]|uniref:PLP-dependent cysteine synthase family protein n=1 Tax=Nocardia sp. alder85J TaxID=2862949 RepID=UPI001CD40285|nr:pyridoxal-phosphate dependent enzyme [Nocardia sp. alder85J]MCX4098281.1 pyridoxal-phosphate dependent enzyme [Nocardia sp. alder85J]